MPSINVQEAAGPHPAVTFEANEAEGTVTCTLACTNCTGTSFDLPAAASRRGKSITCAACGVSSSLDTDIEAALNA